jgi:hypothetical protein
MKVGNVVSRYVRIMAFLCVISALFLIPGHVLEAQQAGEPVSALEQGRIFTEWFYQEELDKLHAQFSSEMKGALSLEALTQFRAQIAEQLGQEAEVLDEKVTPFQQYEIYDRVVTFEKYENPMLVEWTLGESNIIYGFFIRPVPQEAPSQYLDYTTKAALHLPFQEEWFVFWGGRSIQENYHAAYPDQRFAYDFVIVKNETTHAGDGTKNEEYYCFGKDILAPASGNVVEAVDGVADNSPGTMNAQEPLGNYVILDHGNGEYSFFAHLKHGSVALKQGDTVEAGQLLGLCGNSGHSSEPHLHYHLQTTAIFQQGEGLPAQFQSYAADGETVERGEPARGQQIQAK